MYNDKFDNLVIDRSEQNNKFFESLANDKDFRDSIMQALLPIVFERIRKNKQFQQQIEMTKKYQVNAKLQIFIIKQL